MKLYITPGSPYARIVRIVLLEKRLEGRIEIVAAPTRLANSPYYRINPSGRVPYLLRDDGIGLEESSVICRYLDHLDDQPAFDPPGGASRDGTRADSPPRRAACWMASPLWLRELRRPHNERSAVLLQHEADRAARMADFWEAAIDHPAMHGALNLAQITLACALGLEARNPDFQWRPGHPKLRDWFDPIAARPSLAATAPPAGR
ncbi:MAG: glutathione S-transferase N-terminal domain-containing protein [Pseudomonadota bacterium]